MSDTSSTPVTSRPSHSWAWAVATVLVVLILVGGYLIYHMMHMPGEVVKGLAGAFQPHIDYKTEISGAIRDLKNNPKLVVMTATIDAQVHKSSSTSALWIYWGTTTVDVRVRENKVQFYVPLEDVGTASFEYDEVHKTLTAWTRAPVLDEDVVDVQTDPGKIEMRTENGWAKFDWFSGAPMREDARHELRNAVIQATKQPAQYELLELKAKANAKENIRKLLEPMARTLRPGVRLEVDFLP